MKWSARQYNVEIFREVDPAHLAELSPAEADEAADNEFLAGNQMYSDMRGFTWADVAGAIAIENAAIFRMQHADDLDTEAELWDEERQQASEPENELWGLDIGVAAATVALSALGAIPVGSCNAGGFGGCHQASHPYVAFFVSAVVAISILEIATAADVGLIVGTDGIARLFGRTDLDLIRFASVAAERHSR